MSDTTPQSPVPEQPAQAEQPDQPEQTEALAPDEQSAPADPQLTASEPVAVVAPVSAPEAEPATPPVTDATQPTASHAPPPAAVPAFPGEQPAAPTAAAAAPIAATTPTAPTAPTAPAETTAPLAPQPVAVAEPQPVPEPIYLSAPVPPLPRSNRGVGMLIALLGAVLYAAFASGAVYLAIAALYDTDQAEKFLERYLQDWTFWIPLAVFVLAFLALVSIANRARWWAYVLGSVFVAAFVFAGFLGALLIELRAWNLTFDDAVGELRHYLNSQAVYPWVAFVSAIVALEIVTWTGLWISARGATVRRRNAEERAAFDAQFAPSAPPSELGA